jgi:hypothetical protein
MNKRTGAALLALLLTTSGCDLDLVNPNSPTRETVITSPDGIIGSAVGLQGSFAAAARDYTLPSALVTDEWGPRSRALAADKSMFAGTPDRSFGIVAEPYRETFDIIRGANDILDNAPDQGFGPALEAGIMALAKLHKAMALGMAIQMFEEMPVAIAEGGSPPQSRDVVLDTVLNLLESARSDLQGITDAQLAASVFNSRVLDPGIDLRSSVEAMLARYYLIDGQYDAAFQAAARADSTQASYYTYGSGEQNPIYQYSIALDYVWPLQSFAREAEDGDERVAFFADTLTVDELVTPALVAPAYYTNSGDPYPLYRPDEITLIQAEVLARNGELQQAIDLINQVRTQCTAGVEDPAPCLPALTLTDLPTQDAVLEQIAYERRYELFLTGLRWEDLRRLAPYVDDAPKTDYLPIPQRECDINPFFNC